MTAFGVLGLVILCGLAMCSMLAVGYTMGYVRATEFLLNREKPKTQEAPTKPMLRRTISEY